MDYGDSSLRRQLIELNRTSMEQRNSSHSKSRNSASRGLPSDFSRSPGLRIGRMAGPATARQRVRHRGGYGRPISPSMSRRPVQRVENDGVRTIDGVEDHVLTGGMAPQTGPQVIPGAARGRIPTDKADLRCDPMRHYLVVVSRSAARRARPRRFTSSASARMDWRVIGMPSPRSIEACAASTAARISAGCSPPCRRPI